MNAQPVGFCAREGRGCSHCEEGIPIDFIQIGRRRMGLCLECVLQWWPIRDATWWEERHRNFADHLDEALEHVRKRQDEESLRAYLAQSTGE